VSDLARVRFLVHHELGAWEVAHPTGSARRAFDEAWQLACDCEHYPDTAVEREDVWLTWLARGAPLTRAREVALLTAAGPGAARILAAIGIPRREPGEEG
jgi:hypothetical protein